MTCPQPAAPAELHFTTPAGLTGEARRATDHSPHVLVAGSDAQVRARLAVMVWQALPAARIEEYSGVSELVFRVAGNSIDLILLQSQALAAWPNGLSRLLKGVRPHLRVATVAAGDAAPVALEGADANLTEATLAAWLQDASRAWA